MCIWLYYSNCNMAAEHRLTQTYTDLHGSKTRKTMCWLELDVEACLHENIEQLTTSVIMALSVRVARQSGQAKLKSVCIAVSCAAARVHGSARWDLLSHEVADGGAFAPQVCGDHFRRLRVGELYLVRRPRRDPL